MEEPAEQEDLLMEVELDQISSTTNESDGESIDVGSEIRVQLLDSIQVPPDIVSLSSQGPLSFFDPPPELLPISDNSSISVIEINEDSSYSLVAQVPVPIPTPQIILEGSSEHIPKPESATVNPVESPSLKRKADHIDDEDGQLCPICLDHWTNSGDHRICALKCGHVYGYKCILRWITENKNCPTCKLKATKNDTRFIYANKLIALDTSELNQVKLELTNALKEKNVMQVQLAQAICKEHMLMEQVTQYKEMIKLASINCTSTTSNNSSSKGILKHFETYSVCPQGTCRVMDSHFNQKLLAVSLKSHNTLFRGYGIKKFNIENMSSVVFIPLHSNAVRDIKFNQHNNYLLSVSLDKMAKVIDINTNNVVAAYNSNTALWSCCWDADEEHVFYVGSQQGSISKFDLRKMSNPVDVYSTPGDLSPVVSLAGLNSGPGNAVPLGGFLACKLNSLWAFEKGTDGYKKHSLPALGPFISMNYDQESQTVLLSARPSGLDPSVRNIVCSLEKQENGPTSTISHNFLSGRVQKQLTRTCLIKNNKNMYVAASNEQTIMIWSVNTGKVCGNLRNYSLAVDLQPFCTGQKTGLLALSEKKVDFYHFFNHVE